jgi:hypothetical protein
MTKIPLRFTPPGLLTTGQVGQIFGVTGMTVWNWVRRGILPASKVSGNHFIDSAILPDWEPPRRSYAYFDRAVYDRLTGKAERPLPRRGHAISTQQAAMIFGVTATTVTNWIRWGLLPATGKHPYRIDAGALVTFQPPRRSAAQFDSEMYEALTRG